jgi:hypothetical protein
VVRSDLMVLRWVQVVNISLKLRRLSRENVIDGDVTREGEASDQETIRKGKTKDLTISRDA